MKSTNLATLHGSPLAQAVLPYVACLATNIQSQVVRSIGDPVLVFRLSRK